MFESITGIAAAVLVAGVVAIAVTAAPAANDGAAMPKRFAKADLVRVPVTRTLCALHGWPNYEPQCQFDLREPTGEARTIRIIALR